jgi:protein TonB
VYEARVLTRLESLRSQREIRAINRMFFNRHRAVSPLWAEQSPDRERGLAIWKAFLIALLIEFLLPAGGYLFNWQSVVDLVKEPKPKPEPIMTVKLDQPPVPKEKKTPPPKPKVEEKPEPDLKRIKNTVKLVPPKPLPNEIPAKIALPKPEPKPKKKAELPPLPSVFQDPCPVNKSPFPVYPRSAEDDGIEGDIDVLITVDDEGNVINAEVIAANPPGVFNKEVLEKVRSWHFKRFCEKGPQFIQRFIFKIDPWRKS